jgi:hypothetical protein
MFADEQERVQKKTFVNWINSYLSKVRKNLTTCRYNSGMSRHTSSSFTQLTQYKLTLEKV